MIEFLKWDTENFNIKVGNVVLNENEPFSDQLLKDLSFAKNASFDLLYLKGVELPNSCMSNNIILADKKVVYAQVINQSCISDKHVKSILNYDLTEDILNLAYRSGKYSRYNTDNNFPKDIFYKLYGIWIKNSVNGTIATDVLAYMIDGKPEGILTYKKYSDKIVIGLVAVTLESEGKGVGSKLMQTFCARFPKGTKIEVQTQKTNQSACHFYERNGFKIESISNIYHIWIK